jgi:glycosyltransferase involved in cell wall biosynthesis
VPLEEVSVDTMVYYDPRWRGAYGIGRFSSAVLRRLPGKPLQVKGDPAAPLDSLYLSFALRHLPRDSVFFSPGFNAPLSSRIPFVFTLHDLNHFDRAENSNAAKRIYYSLVLKRACRRASYVLTVSDYSKSRIMEWSRLPADQVVNVGNGVDAAFNPSVEPYLPGYPYLLCISNRKLHKNEFRVVDAFAQADIPQGIRLIFSGNQTAALAEQIDRRKLIGRVVFAGSIPEAQMPSFYKGAVGLVFPSLYEGFGLPAIEAMACGTPVITSNTTSLPEISGQAALLVNPESVDEIAAVISTLVSDSVLQERLRAEGYLQAKKFTWERTADRIIDVLRRI